MPPSMKIHVHWIELDEKINHLKISKFWNFERKGCMAKNSFFKPFKKKIIFIGFKMSSFRCKSHVKEINMPRNMFGCSLKLILRFFGNFCIYGIKLNYSYMIYTIVKNYLNTWIILYWTFFFSSLKFVLCKCYL